MSLRSTLRLLACPLMFALAPIALAPIALAQDAPKPNPEPAPASDPTLDELLGLPKPAAPPASPPAAPETTPTPAGQPKSDAKNQPGNDAKSDLQRDLEGRPPGEAFDDALRLMADATDRLSARKDVGLATQRVQEAILLRLDKLIDEAEKQRSQSKSKKKQKSSQDKPDESQQQQSQPKSQQAQQQKPGTTGGTPSSASESGAGRPPRAGEEAKWGALPEHVRDALRQGLGDKYSSLYRLKTEEYYKRLAEEPTPSSPSPDTRPETRKDPR